MSQNRFAIYAWGVLGYNLAVILWGAYVRATGSGAGCGNHWPLCNGAVVPRPERVETLIEFTHRAMSGLTLAAVMVLLVWAFRAFPKGHRVRKGALFTLLFTLSEALVGAGLVLLDLVEDNASAARAIWMAGHLVNTFFLLAVITLTAWWGSGGRPIRLRGQGAVGYALGLALLGTLILAVSGAITALGDTLFPARTLVEGLNQDFSPTAHFLIRLRVLHPLIALSIGLYLLLIAGLVTHLRPAWETRRFGRWMAGLFLAQILAGALNWLFHAPVTMQMLHLLLADAIWICLILLTATALAEGVPQVELVLEEPFVPPITPGPTSQRKASWKQYLLLTKPRVISLLLFTTLTAMFAAARGWPGLCLLVAVSIGGYMAAGAANAINMVVERDLDARMKRTAKRPTVTQDVPAGNALFFALGLAVGSFAILWGAANLLTAMLALAGLVFYVIVYTMLLKRRTWHNIVIGGAAGAFPPLVGWAAVTNDLSFLAWCLFAIIFVWTPVHFWALALLMKEDYARAGVPMLPVVLGERVTVLQIGLYSVLTAVISVLPLIQHQAGWFYFGAAMLLNALLLLRSLQLYQQPDRPRAVTLYKYSMVYLALLFLVIAVDRSVM
ncbi:MAG TPA: heme o synthase [Chthonomonadales bacterium]|nr:heme o synthase [Chthonomonadales bacterium]